MLPRGVVFDLDGVLIDSEAFWCAAQTEVFRRAGLDFTPAMYAETMGLRVDEVVEHWYRRYRWEGISVGEAREQIVAAVVEQVRQAGAPKAGVLHAIEFFLARGCRLAVASSSVRRIVTAALAQLRVERYFEFVHSAEQEEYGKPHPGVYLTAARRLGLRPMECLAIEDSFPGVVAAKAARMRCIAVSDLGAEADPRLMIADCRLSSLGDIDEGVWQAVGAEVRRR
jgi:mannitol-1-/sugar-/sorbitol-6-/2-deoxyglucose-6-phosphatase